MKTPISSNTPEAENAGDRIAPGRDSESWARELPAPLPPAEVEAACRELLSVPVRERRDVLHAHAGKTEAAGRMQIVAALVERGYAYRHSDPHAYLRLAQVANQCAYRYLCAPAELRPAGRQLRAGALGFLANAYRIVGELRRAGRIWERLAPEEEGNPVLAGRLFRFRAALARAQRRFPRAIADLNRARARFEEGEAHHEATQAGLVLAKTYEDSGDLEAALFLLAEVIPDIDEVRYPMLSFVARKNEADLLSKMERTAEAFFLLHQALTAFQDIDEPLPLVRARWIEGRLLGQIGAHERAAKVLIEVKDAFVERRLHYDAALAGLELALAYARRQDAVAVMRLAEELYPVFVAHDIPREASMALLKFYRAASDLRASAAVVVRTLENLREIAQRPAAAEAEAAPE